MGPDQALYVALQGVGAVFRYAPVARTGSDCGSAVPSRSPLSLLALAALLALMGVGAAGRRRRRRARGR
jgi:hypothetical protein